MEILGIIPARGGSKSVPRKNIKLLNGMPLLIHAIETAKKSSLITRFIVTTDDDEIARIAREGGGEVPFMRPRELAQDDTTDLPVFQHSLEWLEREEGYIPDIIVNLRPTSPLRKPEHIDEAIQLLQDSKADSVKSVSPVREPPQKMWRLVNGRITPLLPDKMGIRGDFQSPRQSLEPIYWQNGIVDVVWRKIILEKNSMSGNNIQGFILDSIFAVDLDTEEDFLIAEVIFKQLKSRGVL
jgi:N-acylneuraminate cytidylyltransferase